MEFLLSIHTALCLIYSTHKNKYIKDIPVYIFSYNLCCFFISIFFTSQQEIKLHRSRNVYYFFTQENSFSPYNKEKLRIYNWRDSYHTYFMFKFYIWKKSSVDALCIFCHATISSELKYSLWEEGGKLIKPGKKANLRRQGEQKFGRFTNLLKVTRRANT